MAWILIGVLVAGILFGPMISSLRAADFMVVSSIRGGYSTVTWGGNVDSVFLYVLGGWEAGNIDSAQKYTMFATDPEDYGGAGLDSLTRYAIITQADLDADYNPAMWAIWYLNDGREIPDNDPNISALGISATASVDYDSINDIVVAAVSATSGTGVYSDSILVLRTSDSTGIGAGAIVWLRPNNGGDNLRANTDANGWAKFSVDADTFYAYFWTTGYQQVTTPDTNKVGAADCKDTIWVSATTPAAQTSPALTPVAFTFYDGLGSAIKNVVMRYQLESKAATNYHVRDSAIIIDPSKVWEARSNSSGVITINVTPNDSILTTGNKTGETKWRVKAYTPDGLVPLLGNDGVAINVRASAVTLSYPGDF